MGGAAGEVRGVAQGLLASRGVACKQGERYYGTEKEDEKLIVLSGGGGGGLTVTVLVTAILDIDNAADPVSDNESRLNDLKPPKYKKIIYISAQSL